MKSPPLWQFNKKGRYNYGIKTPDLNSFGNSLDSEGTVVTHPLIGTHQLKNVGNEIFVGDKTEFIAIKFSQDPVSLTPVP